MRRVRRQTANRRDGRRLAGTRRTRLQRGCARAAAARGAGAAGARSHSGGGARVRRPTDVVAKGQRHMRTSTSAALSAMALARARRAAQVVSRTHTLWERRERVHGVVRRTNGYCMPGKSRGLAPAWHRHACARPTGPTAPRVRAGGAARGIRVARARKRPPHLQAFGQIWLTCEPTASPRAHRPRSELLSAMQLRLRPCLRPQRRQRRPA